MRKRIIALAIIWTLAFTSLPSVAWAYIDPATTTYIIQVFAAIIITLGVTLSITVYRFKSIVTSVRMRFYRFYAKVIKRQHIEGAVVEKAAKKQGKEPKRIPLDYVLEGDPVGAASKKSISKKNARNGTGTQGSVTAGDAEPQGKWRSLVSDTRSLKQRLLIAALLSAAIVVTFLIFPLLDILISNSVDIAYLLPDIVYTVLLFALIAFVVLTIVLCVCRGFVIDTLIAFFLALLIAGYLQGTFLNPSFGELTGASIEWNAYAMQTLLNLGLWIFIFISVYSIKRFFEKLFKVLVVAFPVLIIAVQLTALFTLVPQLSEASGIDGVSNKVLEVTSTAHLTEVASEDNIVVFVLDTLDNNYVDDVLKSDPTFFDQLDGFTRYTNYISSFRKTFPSVEEMVTGYKFIDGNLEEFHEYAFSESDFIPDLQEEGYSVRLYTDSVYGTYDRMKPLVDNFDSIELELEMKNAYRSLLKLAIYRQAPLALKPSFWTPTGNLSGHYSIAEESNQPIPFDDVWLMNQFKQGIDDDYGEKGFVLYHLVGSHLPVYMNENAEYASASESSVVQQTKGSFEVVYEYIEQLKELGLYDNATIIITADHGYTDTGANTLPGQPWNNNPNTAALFYKPSGVSGIELTSNNAPLGTENFRATIINEAGHKSDAYGQTFSEVSEDDDSVVRRFYWSVNTQDGTYHYQIFDIKGDARDPSNWVLQEKYYPVGDRVFLE